MRPRESGLTLIEMLVALSIFLFLGGALVIFLRVGIDTWRVGEVRREAYERAGAIVDQIADDLACTFSDPSKGTGGVVDVLMLSDYDENGRQRLRFVRSLAGEMRHPITQRAGELTGGQFDYDYVDDARESAQGLLRAPGGLQEVAYIMDVAADSDMLWRGVKSPVGGFNSLFEEETLYDLEQEPPAMTRRLRPFADGVLYWELNFWGQDTEGWGGDESAKAGPQFWWDSTRGIVEPPGGASGSSGYFSPDSRHEFRDDVFPSRVQIVLVLRSARATRFAKLKSPIGTDDVSIPVNNTGSYPEGSFQYVRIGSEWIRYGSKSKTAFKEVERGQRGTEPQEHAVGSPVIYGSTFTRVVRIPGQRNTTWEQR